MMPFVPRSLAKTVDVLLAVRFSGIFTKVSRRRREPGMILLPICFLLLSLASTSFASLNTPYDPFYALALHAPRPSEPPVCRLTPLPALDTVEGDVILSFEEWKVKQFAMETEAKAKADKNAANRSAHAQGVVNAAAGGNDSDVPRRVVPDDLLSSQQLPVSTTQDPLDSQRIGKLSPHFRVPLTDRFNYANIDCSARVHTSHRSAKSPEAILSHKRDRYMLSPCVSPKGEPQYVVVELCDDIRIDTVQLANFEFFSGVFKDFTVSVAKTYTTDPTGWTKAGTYYAKNVRGVQSFHPPTSLRDFYRFIRIDFYSHYGNEFYCPVSLLRVYGLTHLEEWKWDIWEAESGAKLHQKEAEVLPPLLVAEDVMLPTAAADVNIMRTTVSSTMTEMLASSVLVNETQLTKPGIVSTPLAETRTVDGSYDGSGPNSPAPFVAPDLDEFGSTADTNYLMPAFTCQTQDPEIYSGSHAPTSATHDTYHKAQGINDITQTPATKFFAAESQHKHDVIPTSDIPTPNSLSSDTAIVPSLSARTATESPTIVTVVHTSTEQSPWPSPSSISIHSASTPIPHHLPPVSTGGESIYRTIMNRITALEANHTLYMRYVEEQTASVREVLKRLGEDLGRVEAIGKSQTQIFQRALQDWERQRHRLDIQYGELLLRIDYLAAEIVLEKRLGIAQLCLLLLVLVFVGLTRGEALLVNPQPTSMLSNSVREWGRRNLSFSNSWVGRLTNQSRGTTPVRKPTPLRLIDDIDFPVSQHGPEPVRTAPLKPSKRMNIYPLSAGSVSAGPGGRSHAKVRSRSRTPSLRTPIAHQFALDARLRQAPVTPSGVRAGPMQRANSHGEGRISGELTFVSGGGGPRSARRWARSAHLHEVKGSAGRARNEDGMGKHNAKVVEQENMDVFGTTIWPTVKNTDGKLKTAGLENGKLISKEAEDGVGEDHDVWVDTDMDADNSEVETDAL